MSFGRPQNSLPPSSSSASSSASGTDFDRGVQRIILRDDLLGEDSYPEHPYEHQQHQQPEAFDPNASRQEYNEAYKALNTAIQDKKRWIKEVESRKLSLETLKPKKSLEDFVFNAKAYLNFIEELRYYALDSICLIPNRWSNEKKCGYLRASTHCLIVAKELIELSEDDAFDISEEKSSSSPINLEELYKKRMSMLTKATNNLFDTDIAKVHFSEIKKRAALRAAANFGVTVGAVVLTLLLPKLTLALATLALGAPPVAAIAIPLLIASVCVGGGASIYAATTMTSSIRFLGVRQEMVQILLSNMDRQDTRAAVIATRPTPKLGSR